MPNKKILMFVFGTRPEAVKMAPLIIESAKHPDVFEPLVVLTGQHREMLDQVMRIFKLHPDYDLEIMEKDQTIPGIVAKALRGLEEIIIREKPAMLLVQGDTSTAFAAGLSAFYYRIPLGHVEAGLRTFDKWRPFPEEMNRKLISGLADIHFAPTKTSLANLLDEKIPKEKIYLTGNTVIDALLDVADRRFDLSSAGIKLDKNKKMVLVTTHRRENFGEPLRCICRAVKRIAQKFAHETEIILPVHKNPQVKDVVEKILGDQSNIRLVPPQDYEPFVHLMKASHIILTDSGGVQEEAPSLGKPVLVLREKTERPEAVNAGTVKLVGMDEETIYNESVKLLTDEKEYFRMSHSHNPYGDGKACARIINSIFHYFGIMDHRPEEFNAEVRH